MLKQTWIQRKQNCCLGYSSVMKTQQSVSPAELLTAPSVGHWGWEYWSSQQKQVISPCLMLSSVTLPQLKTQFVKFTAWHTVAQRQLRQQCYESTHKIHFCPAVWWLLPSCYNLCYVDLFLQMIWSHSFASFSIDHFFENQSWKVHRYAIHSASTLLEIHGHLLCMSLWTQSVAMQWSGECMPISPKFECYGPSEYCCWPDISLNHLPPSNCYLISEG